MQLAGILPPHGALLGRFLVPRPVGGEAHRRLQRFIKRYFARLRWEVRTDEFFEETPLGGPMIRFTNLIATLNPAGARRIVLAAHYDSKRSVVHEGRERFDFVGATDSAWSCAFLLQLAASLPPLHGRPDLAVQIVLFDGEEALERWSEKDSIYGARHLAERWRRSDDPVERIDRVAVMVLLDLLGAKQPALYSLFEETWAEFEGIARTEARLRQEGQLRTAWPMFHTHRRIASVQQGQYMIEDDHVPFSRLGTPVLHLIPLPFPAVWHTIADDAGALHADTCHDLAVVLHTFICEKLLFTY